MATSTTMSRPPPSPRISKGKLALMAVIAFVGFAYVCYAWDLAPVLPAIPFLAGPAKAAAAPSAPSSVDYDTVAPFIFDSVKGLLGQWSNSYAPNGHSIVAGTLSPATVLYHATQSAGPPGKPTFFAFDA